MNSPARAPARIDTESLQSGAAKPVCPACGYAANGVPLEAFHGSSLYSCDECDLHYWHPAKMPDAGRYETAYQDRDRTAMPLEPGHQFFLADPKAPKRGRLLDLGCGVGNFLAAARDAGFVVSGAELNRNAVRFAREHYKLRDVVAATPQELRAARPNEQFDVVTFFEVLEHQDDPQLFLDAARDFLTSDGYIALSVPNRNRWQKGVETLDYPPNHLTRWSPLALSNFLVRNAFEVLSLCEEPLRIRRAAQVMSMGLRTGLMKRVTRDPIPTMADLVEMRPEEMARAIARLGQESRQRIASRLARWKNSAMIPGAALLLPYFRLRKRTGLYLYCLARRKREAGK